VTGTSRIRGYPTFYGASVKSLTGTPREAFSLFVFTAIIFTNVLVLSEPTAILQLRKREGTKMAVTIRELTTCYKCERPMMSDAYAVHPLCEICEQGFDEWFTKQLQAFK
jgi:hypothetical protein